MHFLADKTILLNQKKLEQIYNAREYVKKCLINNESPEIIIRDLVSIYEYTPNAARRLINDMKHGNDKNEDDEL